MNSMSKLKLDSEMSFGRIDDHSVNCLQGRGLLREIEGVTVDTNRTVNLIFLSIIIVSHRSMYIVVVKS